MKYYYERLRLLKAQGLSKSLGQTSLLIFLSLALYQSMIGVDYIASALDFNKGEVVKEEIIFEKYNFSKATPFFRSLNTKFISAVNKKTFETEILLSMPPNIRSRAVNYLEDILNYSQKHNLDPIWVLAIIWTESHFSSIASSRVAATGLMQIMPGTGVFLAELLNKPVDSLPIKKMLIDPELNIELGTFYLKRLLKRFKSHRLATVAYNMGPSFVRRRLNNGKPIGRKNIYYDKVKKYYRFLLRGVKRLEKQSIIDGKQSILAYNQNQYDMRYYLGHDIMLKFLPMYASR